MVKRASVLGIDVGGVIIGADNDTTMFTKNYLEAQPVPGAFEAIRVLHARFLGQIIIVSKAGPEMQDKTMHWMEQRDFWNATGMLKQGLGRHPDQNVFFCRERADKAPICKRMNVTHFIDDRLDVLVHLTTVKKRFLFGSGGGRGKGWKDAMSHKAGIYKVADWPEVLERVRP